MEIKRLIVILLITRFYQLLHSQTSVNTAGGSAKGSGGTVEYSVGQTDFNYYIGTTIIVSQGVQHAYEVFSVGAINPHLKMAITAFPNPSADQLMIKINDVEMEGLRYQLQDLQGKLLAEEMIKTSETQIKVSDLIPAAYYIVILNSNNTKIQTYKIIKI